MIAYTITSGDVDRCPKRSLAPSHYYPNRWTPDGRRCKCRPVHNFTGGTCTHPRCGPSYVSGWQCAECGHYFPREAVAMGADSEPRCREGMGHNRKGAYGSQGARIQP